MNFILTTKLFVLFFFCCIAAFSQPNIQSPNVATLNKFIDFPVDKSTGIPTIEIPIHTLSYSDFSLPISISYHAGGIKVEEMASNIGLGWALNVGAVVSRSVRSEPDEMGYYGRGPVALTPGLPLYDNDGTQTYWPRIFGDTEPDLFYFNIDGASGKFVIDKNKKIHVIPEQDIKIEALGTGFSGWQITTPNGTQYLFSVLYTDFVAAHDPAPLAWHVSKIITPNLNEIEFEYTQHGYSLEKVLNHESKVVFIKAGYTETLPMYRELTILQEFNSYTISKIKSNKYEVEFKYKTIKREDFHPTYSYMFALDNIEIKDKINNASIKKIVFNTSYFTANGHSAVPHVEDYHKKRLRLDAVQECNGEGGCIPPYKFSYNKFNPTPGGALPVKISCGQDVWGLYNGHDENVELYPTLTDPNVSTIVYVTTSNNRNPDEDHSKAFILDEVIFPTGGSTSYVYQGIRATPSSTLLGGLRVKEITNTPQYGPAIVKSFSYANPVIVGGAPKFTQLFSGGDINEDFNNEESPLFGTTGCSHVALAFTSPTITGSQVTSKYIFHGKVIESQPGNGYQESYFDIESVFNETSDLDNNNYFPVISIMPMMLGNKLIKEIFKDANNVPLREVNYSYGYYSRRAISSLDAYRKFTPIRNERYKRYALNTGCAFLKTKEERTYKSYPTEFLTTSISYEYAGIPLLQDHGESLHHLVSKEVTQGSNIETFTKRYRYPLDYYTSFAGFIATDTWQSGAFGIKSLVERWMIGSPLEEVSTVTRHGIETITSGKISFYESLNYPEAGKTQVNLKSTHVFEPLVPVEYFPAFLSVITKSGNNYQLTYNTGGYKPKIYFDRYDSFGNILEYHEENNLHTTFLWGYSHSVPVAKIINATYPEVANVLTQSVIDIFGNNPGTDSQLRLNLQPLREHAALNKARASTYTYTPLFGITSMTDSNNVSTYYEYDGFGRLRFIKDHNSMILKKFVYNYKNQ
jgi:hypothetical protein